MITKERLKELIKQEKKIYIVSIGIDVVRHCKLNTAFFVDSVGFLRLKLYKEQLGQFIGAPEELFETEEEAEWHLKFGRIRRLEELNLPMYNGFDTPDTLFTSANKDDVRLRVGATYINILINDKVCFQELATELNYIKACKMCKKLFLGEEV